jgi:glycosyltransferase involved in cell wall biosynthesis
VAELTVAVDATPLIGARTGIGRYVDQVVRAMAALPDPVRLVLTGITARGGSSIPRDGTWRVVARPFPARLARSLWLRGVPAPSGRWFAGPHDVFHGTNFVLPPCPRVAGVVTVHDLAWLLLPHTVAPAESVLRELVPRSLRRAALVLVPSRAVADLVAEHLAVPPDRIRVTPLGVDRGWFATRPDPEVAARWGLPERYVVVVATRQPRKNLPFLLQAHRRACAENPDTPALVLVGGRGWGEDPATADGPARRVVRTGYLPEPALRATVAGACAAALPSLDEGFGLPLLEAFAAGIPVLASDLPVLREVSGGRATFADPGDLDGWAGLLARPPQTDAQGLREWASAWTWRRCAEATVAAYHDAATQDRPRPRGRAAVSAPPRRSPGGRTDGD